MAVNLKRIHRKALIASAIVIVAGVSFLYLTVFRNGSNPPNTPTELVAADGQKVDLEPATSQERAESDAHKEEIVKRDERIKNPPTPSTNAVTVVITEATKNVVRAYINGVFEDGGICTATAVQGTQTYTATSTGFKNVSYTQCEPISWNLGSGTWTVTVSYKSSTSEGNSQVKEVNT